MSKRPTVVVAEHLDADGLEVLREGGAQVFEAIGQSHSALTALLQDAEALIVRSKTQVDAKMIAAAPALRVVARAGVGTDSIDVDAATRQGILVLNTPDASTLAVAEHTIALMLATCRHLVAAHARIAAEKWSAQGLIGSELAGKTLGIVGLGRIGAAVASRALAFGMKVLAFDAFISRARADAMGVTLADLETLLSSSDIVSLHAPLTPQTRGMLGALELRKMRQGAMLVNCGRGELVDEGALLHALESEHLAAAALDVVSEEPPASGSPVWRLLHHPRVIATPHLGASTREAQARIATDLCRDVLAVLRGTPPSTAINASVAPPEVRPFVTLANVLGRALPQLAQAQLSSFSLSLEGELAPYDAEPFDAAFLAGLLSHISDRRISAANSHFVAHEMGVGIETLQTPCRRGFTHALSVRCGEKTLAGTVVAADRLRLIEIDGFEIEIAPHAHLLLTRHRDVPGIVGSVGMLLGTAGINIATMSLARNERGEALMLLGVDREPNRAELSAIRTIGDITHVAYLSL